MIRRAPVVTLITLALLVPTVVAAAPPAAPQAVAADGRGGFQAGKPSQDWRRVRTANFEAVGNAPSESIRQILEQLEVYRSTLVTRLLGLRTTSSLPTLVIVFKDREAFEPFQPRDRKGRRERFVAAYFLVRPDTNLIVLPDFTDRADSLRVAYHEYFHFVVGRNMPTAPLWLNEGLSEFYSTFTFDPATRDCTIGAVIPYHAKMLLDEKLIPPDELLSRNGASKILRSGDPRRIAMFYAESWALVHFLMAGSKGQGAEQIRAYLAATDRGVPIDQAFRAAFGVATADLPRLLADYMHRKSLPGLWFQWGAATLPTEARISPMTEAESEFVQGDLLMTLGIATGAERSLKAALALDPSASATKVALAILRRSQGRSQEAVDALRQVALAEQGNLRAHLALAQIWEESRQYEEAFAEYSRAVTINDQATAGWYGRAAAALALGRVDESDSALVRLQALDRDPGWYQSRGYLAFDLGNFAVAARDARAYIDEAGPNVDSAPYMAFLGAICLRRAGRAADADKILGDVRPALVPDSWPAKVMGFVEGKLDAGPFLAGAKSADQKTEAHAYVAFRLLQNGRQTEALSELRWVKEHGTRTFYEYRMAASELERLQKTPEPIRTALRH